MLVSAIGVSALVNFYPLNSSFWLSTWGEVVCLAALFLFYGSKKSCWFSVCLLLGQRTASKSLTCWTGKPAYDSCIFNHFLTRDSDILPPCVLPLQDGWLQLAIGTYLAMPANGTSFCQVSWFPLHVAVSWNPWEQGGPGLSGFMHFDYLPPEYKSRNCRNFFYVCVDHFKSFLNF